MELQQRQRQFVQQLVQECTDDLSKDVSTARSYVRGCLKFHVRGAVKIPWCEDADVLSWLMHSDDEINSQALQGCGASKVNDLALWLRENGELFTAAQLWSIVGNASFDLFLSKGTRAQYFRHARQALAKIPAGTQPGALSLEVVSGVRVLAFSANQQEKAECLKWMADLSGDEERMGQLDAQGKAQYYFAVSGALILFTSSHYCTRAAAPIGQLKRGARLFLQYGLIGYSDWAERTEFLKFYAYGHFTLALTLTSICYINSDVTNDRAIVSKLVGQEGEKLRAWHATHSLDFHQRVSLI
jgi:hypothetical protein